jgi:hypothetical protein
MNQLDAFFAMISVIGICLFSTWFGAGVGVGLCAQNGEFTHKILDVTVECKVKQ